ncbi:MAG: hypothetical protein E7573_04920 [Ruminococcaceae bacterium]|nr:hypothetical protein [Oscillospiraceae bacterium]
MKKTKKLFSIIMSVCIFIAALPVFGFAFPVNKEKGPFNYYIENGYAVINDYDGSVTGELVIPEKLGGYPVGGITRWKFQNDPKITSVVLPDGFLYLGELVFAGCFNLTKVTLPDSLCGVGRAVFNGTPWYEALPKNGDIYIGNVLAEVDKNRKDTEIIVKEGTTGIADYLFINNTVLQKVVLPESCNYIGENAFNGCTSLKEIIMPENIKYMGQYAFGNCSSLEKFNIPTGINRISNALLYGASALKEIIIPYEVKDIGSGAFSRCFAITSVIIPDGVERIAGDAFSECTALEEVTIPVSMKIIESGAFGNCKNLKTLIYKGTDEQYSGIVLGNKDNDSFVALKEQNRELQENTVYVPCSFEVGTMTFPRGTSVADYCEALFEPFTSVAKPDNGFYSFEEILAIIVSGSILEKGLADTVIGDLDNNGKIEASDARLALRSSVGLETVDFAKVYTADIDNDKYITSADARIILRASVGLEDASLWK